MAVYVLGRPEKYVHAGLEYVQNYIQRISEGNAQYVCTEVMEQEDIEIYIEMGISAEQILGIHQYLTGSSAHFSLVKAENKLEELKDVLQYTGIYYRDSEICLTKDGYVIATILLDKRDKNYFTAISYYCCAKLLRMEFYADRVFYVNYYVTAKSENGLYAKLVRRCFYNRDGSVAYNQILEEEKEWYLFPDGRCYTKQQFVAEFVKRLNLSEQDRVILDTSVPQELMQAIFTYGKGAKLTAIVHAGRYFGVENNVESFLSEYPYYWFRYVDMIGQMIVSTKTQKLHLIQELEKYHCIVPDIRVLQVEGEFTYTVLNKSYGGNMALSWYFTGKPDGYFVYDESGEKIYETGNKYQHYFLVEGYEKEKGFVIKAYIDTAIGKEIIAESETVYLRKRSYEKPLVSLVIPAYNAEDYIARTMDNALAQSLIDLEIIAVDDGSVDSTADMLDWYAEKYLSVIVIHQKNEGVAAARNMGIRAANGEYIGFMDSDDMIQPEMMERLYCSAIKNDCDIACTSAYEIRDSGYVPFMHYPIKEDVAVPIEEYLNQQFATGSMWTVTVWNKIYRSSLVKTRLFPVIISEDEAWTPYILSWANNICWINEYLYEYDRIIRSSTLADEVMKQTYEEKFDVHMKDTLFYLKNGNPERRKLLKELARGGLYEWGKIYAYDRYEEVWKKVDESFKC